MNRSMLRVLHLLLFATAPLAACGPGDEVVVIDPPPAKVKDAPPPVPTDPAVEKNQTLPANKEKTANR